MIERYHINYDGKILPCRAKIQVCPYGPGRHAKSYDELYYRYQETYNNINPSPALIEKLKSGEPLHGIKDLDAEIANSDSPIELICSSLKLAIKNAGASSLTSDEYKEREAAISRLAEMRSAGVPFPESLPSSLLAEGRERDKSGLFSNFFGTQDKYDSAKGLYRELLDRRAALNRIEKKYKTGYQFTPDQLNTYKKNLRTDFNYWAGVLNARKIISQPMIIANNNDELLQSLNSMSNDELLSLYDDATVSDNEVRYQLDSVNNFGFDPIEGLSDQANMKLVQWFTDAGNAERRYIIGSSQRTLVALNINHILNERHVNHGDMIYTYNEEMGAQTV